MLRTTRVSIGDTTSRASTTGDVFLSQVCHNLRYKVLCCIGVALLVVCISDENMGGFLQRCLEESRTDLSIIGAAWPDGFRVVLVRRGSLKDACSHSDGSNTDEKKILRERRGDSIVIFLDEFTKISIQFLSHRD